MRNKHWLLVTLLAFGALLLWLTPASAAPTRIHLIQGIPDTKVDIEIRGKTVIRDLGFRGTYDLSSLNGPMLPAVSIKRAGTSDVLLAAGDVTLPTAPNVTVVLHLKIDGNPGLASFSNDISSLKAGESRLIVRHLAAAPPVDVTSAGKVVFANLANGGEVKADLPAGTVSASLVPAGVAGPAILGPADISLSSGAAIIVYGLGSLSKNTMAVATESIPGLGPAPTRVNTGDSPVMIDADHGSAWIWLAPATALLALATLAGRSGWSRRRPA